MVTRFQIKVDGKLLPETYMLWGDAYARVREIRGTAFPTIRVQAEVVRVTVKGDK